MTSEKNHGQSPEATFSDTPTVSPVIGQGSDAHRLVRVGAWNFTAQVLDEEPRIRDVDLAERLGYERPRTIRDLIQRMLSAGKLNESELRRTARQTVGRPAEEIWLTEAQALKVTAKSDAAIADEMLDEVIRVFVLARRGLLPQQAISAEGLAMAIKPIVDQAVVEAVAPLIGRVADVHAMAMQIGGGLAELAHAVATGHALAVDTNKHARRIALRDGTLEGEEADKIRAMVARIVELRAAKGGVLGDRRAMGSIRADVYADLFAYLDWGRKGQGIAAMPAAKGPFAKAHLDYQVRKLLRGDKRTPPAGGHKQPGLFDEKVN